MPSVEMNRLMDNARVRLPGALDATIQSELFSVVDDFCRTAGVWTYDFDIDVLPTTQTFLENEDAYTYQVFPPTGATSVRLLQALNSNLAPVPARMLVPNYVQFGSAPAAEEVWTIKVVLSVTDPVTRQGEPIVPGWIVDRYNDVLLDGVLSRMMSQAAKPYTSDKLAIFHGNSFRSGKSKARIEALRGNVYRAQNWNFPQTFATRGR